MESLGPDQRRHLPPWRRSHRRSTNERPYAGSRVCPTPMGDSLIPVISWTKSSSTRTTTKRGTLTTTENHATPHATCCMGRAAVRDPRRRDDWHRSFERPAREDGHHPNVALTPIHAQPTSRGVVKKETQWGGLSSTCNRRPRNNVAVNKTTCP